MPTPLTHAVAAAALAPVVLRRPISARVVALGAVGSTLPDLDVLGFGFGIRYGDPLGHRGLTHSIAFAALLSLLLLPLAARADSRRRLWLYLFLAVASHGILDALTDGGLGVALLAPFDWSRYFFPWRPIRVAPIGVDAFFSERGRLVLASELLWLWVPSVAAAAVALLVRRPPRATVRRLSP
jgi:inner membrane protein